MNTTIDPVLNLGPGINSSGFKTAASADAGYLAWAAAAPKVGTGAGLQIRLAKPRNADTNFLVTIASQNGPGNPVQLRVPAGATTACGFYYVPSIGPCFLTLNSNGAFSDPGSPLQIDAVA
jgi:hypothetical protein